MNLDEIVASKPDLDRIWWNIALKDIRATPGATTITYKTWSVPVTQESNATIKEAMIKARIELATAIEEGKAMGRPDTDINLMYGMAELAMMGAKTPEEMAYNIGLLNLMVDMGLQPVTCVEKPVGPG